ncbi:MAG: cell envelope biogenesis protein OmpA [Acetobacteraceae bacterium]|nr:cell envelope biogenesis protein OmpA [Acetobacteraceae bacterium]
MNKSTEFRGATEFKGSSAFRGLSARSTAVPAFHRTLAVGLAASLLLALAGCGNDPLTRGVSGGLLGAGAGAGVAAVSGGKPATGALIGGGIGAAGGALTAP